MSELKFKLLPTTLINEGFVQRNPNSNYEKYLLEFVNSSPFFLEKSKGQLYTSPESEERGQCDCISDNFTLDFKMIISPTMAQAKNLFTQSICQVLPGVTIRGDAKIKPSDKRYRPIEATVLHTWFRELNVEKLHMIFNSATFSISAYKDIKSILGAIDKPKNILCMLPYEYIYDNKEDIITYEAKVIDTISQDYKSLMEYRLIIQPNYDNYIAFVFSNKLIILQYNKTRFEVVDSIPLNKSEIFQQLKEVSGLF